MRKTREGPIQLVRQTGESTARKVSENQMVMADFIDRFILYCRSEGMAYKTIETYINILNKFNWWYTEYSGLAEKVGPHPSNFTEDHIREFLLYLRSEVSVRWGEPIMTGKEKLSPTTVYNYSRTVRTFFNWLKRRHIVDDSPFNAGVSLVSRKDGVKKRHHNNLSEAELKQLFKYVSNSDYIKKYNGARNFAMLSLILDSGMRMGEVLSMRICDIEWERKRVTIRGKTGERICFFSRTVQEAMDHYHHSFRVNQEDLLHPTDKYWLTSRNSVFSEGAFWHMIENVSRGSGVKFHAHQLRHTFASIMVKRVSLYEVKELLGHTDINTTLIYTHGNPDDNQAAHIGNSPLSVLDLVDKVKVKNKPGPKPTKKK